DPDLRQLGYEEVLARVGQGLDPIAAQGWHGTLAAGDDEPADVAGSAVARSADDAGDGQGDRPPDRLATYRSMRDASRTPEPVPDAAPAARSGNSFVIQEHHARRLHWDYRLERDGVLVSWAVPKGPPLSSGKNRLAVHTEDHPLEYGSFAGEIPKGEYGAGTVTIWDSGTYETEKWRDDEVIAVLHGRPDGGLGGVPRRYALIRTGKGEEDTWLLHLMKDQPQPADAQPSDSRPVPVPEPASAAESANAAQSERAPASHPRTAGAPAVADLPLPMLATPGTVADLAEGDWAYEMKWDGVRAIVGVGGGGVVVMSRNGNDVTASYPELAELADRLVAEGATLDGEIVA
ncbi:MAG: ATP-dependent DNA ligase, partial [Actinomycetes bacterium]|nr:ATP-dependent DNA ligase [Actinomycetes bacterium]